MKHKKMRPELLLFFLLTIVLAFAGGFSDSVTSNYFKDVYDVSAAERGAIEIPRELPGFFCAFLISFLSSFGDIKTALIAQFLSFGGILVLGLSTPSFALMLLFLFIFSTGTHILIPLRGSIGMALSEPDRVGERMGQLAGAQNAAAFVAAFIVFFGFRLGFFTFKSDVKWIFVVAALLFLLAAALNALLLKKTEGRKIVRKKVKLVFRKEYKYYYYLTILSGVQKQIALVYGSWVIIDLLLKGADVMALLTIASSFLCIFFMNWIGRSVDKYGIKKMMYVDALTFVIVYALFGLVVWFMVSGRLPASGFSVWLVYILFILDRLSMQIGMVKTVYLRQIALSDEDVTATLSMGTTLDHIVTITASLGSGVIWETFGSYWVFFIASFFSLFNLYIAYKIQPEQEMEHARNYRLEQQNKTQQEEA